MSKARMYGLNKAYVPNNIADRRYRPDTFFRGKEQSETASDRACEKREKKQLRELEAMKLSQIHASEEDRIYRDKTGISTEETRQLLESYG